MERYSLRIDLLPDHNFVANSLKILKESLLRSAIASLNQGDEFIARIYDAKKNCIVYTLRGTRVISNFTTFRKISEITNKVPLERDINEFLYR